MLDLLKGSAVSVSLGDVDGDGKADVTLAVRVGKLIDLPPLTINLDVGTVAEEVGSFLMGLVFGQKTPARKAKESAAVSKAADLFGTMPDSNSEATFARMAVEGLDELKKV